MNRQLYHISNDLSWQIFLISSAEWPWKSAPFDIFPNKFASMEVIQDIWPRQFWIPTLPWFVTRSHKQAQRDRCRFHLIFLYLLNQYVLRVILQIEIKVSIRSPLPSWNEQRVPVDIDVAEDPQQALACIFCFCKLNSHIVYMVEIIIG